MTYNYNYTKISNNINNISDDKILEMGNKLNWNIISRKNLTKNQLIKFKKYIIWSIIDYKNKNILKALEYIKDYIYWDKLLNHQNLSQNIIKKYVNNIGPNTIIINKNISEDFIEKYKNKINFDLLLINENFTFDKIIKYKEYFDWYNVGIYKVKNKNEFEIWEKYNKIFNWCDEFEINSIKYQIEKMK